VEVQNGRSLGIISILSGILLLSVQALFWFRVYAPPASAKKVNTPVMASSDPAPTKLPAVIGSIFWCAELSCLPST